MKMKKMLTMIRRKKSREWIEGDANRDSYFYPPTIILLGGCTYIGAHVVKYN